MIWTVFSLCFLFCMFSLWLRSELKWMTDLGIVGGVGSVPGVEGFEDGFSRIMLPLFCSCVWIASCRLLSALRFAKIGSIEMSPTSNFFMLSIDSVDGLIGIASGARDASADGSVKADEKAGRAAEIGFGRTRFGVIGI